MRILIADDEKQMLKILAAFLGKEGYDVDVVEDGEQAVQKFHEKNYDLVILDWMMPKKDGLMACQEIKA
ncbi:MAG: response regulator transcription factor, partial [Culicoidibacterales bacterium]